MTPRLSRPCLTLLLYLPLNCLGAVGQVSGPRTVAAESLIIVDAGHGGGDTGARGANTSLVEKKLALDLAYSLADMLRTDTDRAVILSRSADIDLTLPRRAEIANNASGVLLVSLHAGASPNPTLGGGQVYFYGESPPRSLPLGALPVTGSPRSPLFTVHGPLRMIPWGNAYVGYRTGSNDLAAALQAELNNLYGISHQVRTVPAYLLKCVTMPSVLVEVGYLSNPDDERRLLSGVFEESLVRSLANGIVTYLSQVERVKQREP